MWMVSKVCLVPLTGLPLPEQKDGWHREYSFIISAESNKADCKQEGLSILLLGTLVSPGKLGF